MTRYIYSSILIVIYAIGNYMPDWLQDRIEQIAQSPDELTEQEQKELQVLVESWLTQDIEATYTSIMTVLIESSMNDTVDWLSWELLWLARRLTDPTFERVEGWQVVWKIKEWLSRWLINTEHVVLLELFMILEKFYRSKEKPEDLWELLDWKIEPWFEARLESWMASLANQENNIIVNLTKKLRTWGKKSQTVIWSWIRNEFGAETPEVEWYTRVRHTRNISDDLQVSVEWEYTKNLSWETENFFWEIEKKEDEWQITTEISSSKIGRATVWYSKTEQWSTIAVTWTTTPIKISKDSSITANAWQTRQSRENFEWQVSQDIQTTAGVRLKTKVWKWDVTTNVNYTQSDRVTWDPMNDLRRQMLWWSVDYRNWRNTFSVSAELPVWPDANQQRRGAAINASTRYQVVWWKKWKPTVNINATLRAQQSKDDIWDSTIQWQWEVWAEVRF